MAKRPDGDLGAMAISKASAAAAVPFAAPVAPAAAPPAGASQKSLTVKLDGDLYAALRAYCFEQEKATGNRLTHQRVMVQALRELLDRTGGS